MALFRTVARDMARDLENGPIVDACHHDKRPEPDLKRQNDFSRKIKAGASIGGRSR
jgi:hypothetical protein